MDLARYISHASLYPKYVYESVGRCPQGRSTKEITTRTEKTKWPWDYAMKLTPMVEDLIDRIFNKLRSKHNAAMGHVYNKKMQNDPEFRRRMGQMDQDVKKMQDFVTWAKSDPERKKRIDQLLRGEL